MRSRAAVALVVTLAAAAALVFVLTGRRGQFSTAMLTAPVWLLSIAALLQLASLVTRSEAWNFCMRTAGGSTPRRVVFRAAGVGALASVLSAQLGVATRIGALRRTAPHTSPAGSRRSWPPRSRSSRSRRRSPRCSRSRWSGP